MTAKAELKSVCVLLLAAIISGCGRTEVSTPQADARGLQLTCSMTRAEFEVGEELPPPELTITNTTGRRIDLVGPTLTVISSVLVEPDSGAVRMLLAMPTGRDPTSMPRRRLESGSSIDFAPRGIWYYEDAVGYEPYVFKLEGVYEFRCRYGEVRSNTLRLKVRDRSSALTGASDDGRQ